MNDNNVPAFPVLKYGHGVPSLRGQFRTTPQDFVVDEVLGFDPDGSGEHVWLRVRKTGQNTEWVARQLARFAGVKVGDVGYAGMKDRHAVTTQWFSVYLPSANEPDWKTLDVDGVELLEVTRHGRKLRTGTHRANRFSLLIRVDEGECGDWESRLQLISAQGVPNYFGEQRFGRDDNNLRCAWAMFAQGRRERDRHKQGMYLSAARSALFNEYLSRRIQRGCWNSPIKGDALMLEGSRSFFVVDEITPEIVQRIEQGDLYPTGPLWGKGERSVRGEAAELETALQADFPVWCEGLENARLDMERRSLVLNVRELRWDWPVAGESLRIDFTLGRGAFATSVLRELMLSA